MGGIRHSRGQSFRELLHPDRPLVEWRHSGRHPAGPLEALEATMSNIPTATVADNVATVEGVSTSVYRSLMCAHIADYKTSMKMGSHAAALRALAEASHLGRQWKKSADGRGNIPAVMEAESFIDQMTNQMHALCKVVLAAE
ncbi:MAG: hypothetical protein DI630_31420 [Gordonia sp. (in: high G+C Gram-positive bacteria)]|nr:MAG: hypothetical protein DI630_31420 [Gordonia sp. (in: high G+C Gram-positive bacteria)]